MHALKGTRVRTHSRPLRSGERDVAQRIYQRAPQGRGTEQQERRLTELERAVAELRPPLQD